MHRLNSFRPRSASHFQKRHKTSSSSEMFQLFIVIKTKSRLHKVKSRWLVVLGFSTFLLLVRKPSSSCPIYWPHLLAFFPKILFFNYYFLFWYLLPAMKVQLLELYLSCYVANTWIHRALALCQVRSGSIALLKHSLPTALTLGHSCMPVVFWQCT